MRGDLVGVPVTSPLDVLVFHWRAGWLHPAPAQLAGAFSASRTSYSAVATQFPGMSGICRGLAGSVPEPPGAVQADGWVSVGRSSVRWSQRNRPGRGHRRARRTGERPCRALRLFIRPAGCPLKRKRSEQHHVTALALPNAVIAHRSLIHKARSAGHRGWLLIPRDDRQEDASCSQAEQPAREQDRCSSRIAAPSRIWCDPVTELCYVLFGPVVDPAAADQVARPLVQDCERNPRRCPSRCKRTPVQRELIDDGLGVGGRGWRGRAS